MFQLKLNITKRIALVYYIIKRKISYTGYIIVTVGDDYT